MKVCGDYYYTTGSTLYYKDEDENATIWFYTGDETDVVIPDELDGHPVKKLMWGVFAYCDTIKTLSIPTGVLSFGNSTGDASMAEYATSNNPYKSLAFMLCCDDTERENGNTEKAEKMVSLCEEFDWIPVSMKNDWTTIYGDGVTKK